MRLRRLKQIILTGLGLFSLLSGVAEAANVSRKELEQVEQQVKAQNLEHQRLQEPGLQNQPGAERRQSADD